MFCALRTGDSSPNDAIPLQNYSGDIGHVEPILNGEVGIICWYGWYVREN